MGKKDITLKDYLSDPRRYADLLNGSIFQGRQIIDSSELQDADSVQSKSDNQSILERINDITMKQTKDGSLFAVWTVANQDYLDYGMPVRIMMQDALSYDRQLKEIKRKNQSQPCSANTEEFLSQIRNSDRLRPVITLVVYWGEKKWRGAKSLHDILNFGTDSALANEMRRLVPEYPLHFLDLSEVHNYGQYKTELKILFELYSLRKDRASFVHYLHEHDECRHMDAETCWTLGILLNTTKFKAIITQLERTEHNMGNVIDELIADSKEEGRIEGLKEGQKEGKLTILYSLVHDGLLSVQVAAAKAAMTENVFIAEMHKSGY